MILREYQERAVDLLWRYFMHNGGNPVLEAPTGAGKSVIQAAFIQRALAEFPQTRILALCHVKELIEQNSAALIRSFPQGDIGIHSAGLGRRDTGNQVIFAGVQSAIAKINELGRFDLVFVDEAHLVPAKTIEGQYRKLLDRLRLFNPKIKVVGFTATPYRLDGGLLTSGDKRLFTDLIAAETAGMGVRDLLAGGYLAPLTTAPVSTRFDVSDVRTSGGDYVLKALGAAMAAGDATERACDEILRFGEDRNSWLIFATDVVHAHRIRDYLADCGVVIAVVTGDTPKESRDRMIADFRAGRLRALVNVNVLTTGFDAPQTDLLAFLRPTKSTGLYVQACGRGMRIAAGKADCLVLDFAGNIDQHGPVDRVKPKLKRGEGGQAPVRECPSCAAIMPAASKVCPGCGESFEIDKALKLSEKPSAAAILSSDEQSSFSFAPGKARVFIHTKEGSPDMLRVDWYAGMRKMASEWVCLFHDGFPQRKAIRWWFDHVGGNLPADIAEAHQRACSDLRLPTKMCVYTGGKFPEITRRSFKEVEAA